MSVRFEGNSFGDHSGCGADSTIEIMGLRYVLEPHSASRTISAPFTQGVTDTERFLYPLRKMRNEDGSLDIDNVPRKTGGYR